MEKNMWEIFLILSVALQKQVNKLVGNPWIYEYLIHKYNSLLLKKIEFHRQINPSHSFVESVWTFHQGFLPYFHLDQLLNIKMTDI